MIHVYRYLSALTLLLVLCGTYALAVTPLLEPPPIEKAVATTDDTPLQPQISASTAAELEWLFPPDAWQRKEPKIVETEQCTLLIQDYKRLPDGGLELKPCTLIFHSSRSPATAEDTAARGRPIVLDAPKAEIRFDRDLDLARATFGRVEKGTLSGEITIYSPPTTPESRDELRVRTRAVWLDRQSIRTANDVEFVYGDSSGRGRELEIALIQNEPGRPRAEKSKFGGIRSVTLKHLNHLRIATAGRGLLGDAIPAKDKKNIDENAPIEVTCRGEFAFDVPGQLARFVDQVEVRRLIPNAPPDRLRCDELLMAFASPKEAAPARAAAASDPLAGRLQRIIAIGSPAVLEAPSSGLQAVGAHLEYSLADRFVTLKANDQKQIRQVSLRQFEQHCVAREVHYQMAEQGRLGRLQAKGPGELRLLQGHGTQQQIVTARWERELLIQPQERNHVISLLDAASVTVDPLGRFDANELHLWVLEVPVEAAPAANEPQQPAEAQATRPKTTIVPDRLLAIGKVRVVSQRLDMDTSRMEAWFTVMPADPAQIRPLAPPGPIREPAAVQPAAFSASAVSATIQPQATIQNVIRPPNMQKFHVGGGMIQMQLVVRGPQFEVENLNIRGQAEIDEIRTLEPGQEPIRVRGEVLELRSGTTPEATLDISGRPAEVAARGMSLAGGTVHVHRGTNEMTIPGPGEATMPAAGGAVMPFGSAAAAPARPAATLDKPEVLPQKMHITWEQGLTFDGARARFEGGVVIRTAMQTAHAPLLEATLSQRIDFQATGGQPSAELAQVFLDGGMQGVFIESRSVNELGEEVSHEQMLFRSLSFNRLSGKLHADGPGWVCTVRRGGAGLPAAAPAQQPPASPAAAPGGAQSLSSVHVAFERAMEGNLAKRQIDFIQQVRTTYSPAQDFHDVIAADPLAKLAEGVVLMESDTLKLTEFIQPTARWFEMEAGGHTKVRGMQTDVEAPVVGYSSRYEVLTLRGDGRATAKVWSSQTAGQQPTCMEADVFGYNLRTGEMKSEGIRNVHVPLDESIKLPQVPSLAPGARPGGRR